MDQQIADELKTLRDYIRWGASQLAAAGVAHGHGMESPVDEAAYLAAHVAHLAPRLPDALLDARLTGPERQRYLDLLEQRLRERRPLAYITGEAWFAGLRFCVDERVLVPRSPIAELIEQGFKPWLPRQPSRILDLCTGSGCIAIACAWWLGARVDAVDISAPALEVARINARAHGVASRVRMIEADLFARLEGERYDLIISNPPYVAEAEWAALAPEFHHEPAVGLKSGQDGLDLPLRILAAAGQHLADDGVLIVEVGATAEALERVLPRVPFTWIDFERGGEGVLTLSRQQLRDHQPELVQALAERAS